jgi:hypothetical protein
MSLITRLWHNAIGIRNAPEDIEERVIMAGFKPERTASDKNGWDFYIKRDRDLTSVCGILYKDYEPIEVRRVDAFEDSENNPGLMATDDPRFEGHNNSNQNKIMEKMEDSYNRSQLGPIEKHVPRLLYGAALTQITYVHITTISQKADFETASVAYTISAAFIGILIWATGKVMSHNRSYQYNMDVAPLRGRFTKGKRAEKTIRQEAELFSEQNV